MSESIIKNTGSARYTVFPIRYHNLWKFYKQHLSTFWTAEEVKLTDDLVDWKNKLNDNERWFIKNILAFFASSDGIVNENLIVNFYNEVQIPEARQFYSVQMMIEAIHSETYSLLIDTYISNTEEKAGLFNAVETIPAVKRKADWAIKWIEEGSTLQQMIPEKHMEWLKFLQESDQYQDQQLNDNIIDALQFITNERPSFAQRLLAFICVEGIFFSGSFCAIYWLKSRGLMPGLSTANSFIAKDEALHADFGIEMYKMLENRLDEKIAHDIFKEAVEIEKEFITESLPVSLIGMNCNLMSQYIEMVADRWLVLLGYNKIYNTQNPFPFMEMISLNEKVNFFENTVTNYQRANVGSTEEDRKITFDSDDF
jgi:ribonucleotide reductase beta subunit family protein with ferritin-like domain